jgi:serine/threonine-protein kinase
MTLPGTTLGSVHYFSPEQARGEPATNASDIFALGIVLFEMLTGHRPWEGDSAASVALARLTGPVPDPATARPSLPPDIAAITRKALARDPADRFASAGAMADALEGARSTPTSSAAGTAAAGAAIAGAGLAGAASYGGVARSNPTVVSYPPDAYAGTDDPRPARPVRESIDRPRTRPPVIDEEDDGPSGTSPVVWVAGIVAIALLAAIAFLVVQMLSGPGTAPPSQVGVPDFVGKTLENATLEADGLGLKLETTTVPSDQPVGIIIEQNPAKETLVAVGSTVRVTVAGGLETVATPELRRKTEAEAVELILAAGLKRGIRTEAYDPTVPVGLIVSQNPAPGEVVDKGRLVDYVISLGPEPTPSPTPSPTPTPTPTPTPEPTPTPTPEPTPTPTPTPEPTP